MKLFNIEFPNELIVFFMGTITLVMAFLYLAFKISNNKREKDGKKRISFIQFINNEKEIRLRNVLVGMSFGLVFGFIDNAGLWIGLEKFEKYISGSILEKAGWGNTFSDALGASLGTAVLIILKSIFTVEEAPIWVDTIGIILGCILGIYIPKYITGRK